MPQGDSLQIDSDFRGVSLSLAMLTCLHNFYRYFFLTDVKKTSAEDRLRVLELFSLKRRRFWGNLIAASQYLKVSYRKTEEGLFIRVSSGRTKGF